jgi:hypothetical protein
MKIFPQRCHYIIYELDDTTTEKWVVEWISLKEAWNFNKPMVIFVFYTVFVLIGLIALSIAKLLGALG